MLLRVRDLSVEPWPRKYHLHRNSYRCLTQGKSYEAHCLASHRGELRVLVVGDDNYTFLFPLWFFDVIDGSIPDDWITSHLRESELLAMGPPFMVCDAHAYDEMVEGLGDFGAKFDRRIDARSLLPIVEALEARASATFGSVRAAIGEYDAKSALEDLCMLVFEHELEISSIAHMTITRLARYYDVPNNYWEFLPVEPPADDSPSF